MQPSTMKPADLTCAGRWNIIKKVLIRPDAAALVSLLSLPFDLDSIGQAEPLTNNYSYN